jgi:hypothetical protein
MSERIASAREVARRLGLSHTAIQKAEQVGRITREQDGAWDLERVRRELAATADPNRSRLAQQSETSPLARLTIARLALGVEAQRLALDQAKGKLINMPSADARIDEVAGAMRDALLNWPARVSGQIAAEIGRDPHLVQTLLQEQITALLAEMADRLDPPQKEGEAAMLKPDRA